MRKGKWERIACVVPIGAWFDRSVRGVKPKKKSKGKSAKGLLRMARWTEYRFRDIPRDLGEGSQNALKYTQTGAIVGSGAEKIEMHRS